MLSGDIDINNSVMHITHNYYMAFEFLQNLFKYIILLRQLVHNYIH